MDLGIREAKRRARLLGGLRGERLDSTEHHALAIGGRRRKAVCGRFCGAGECLDVDQLGAEILERRTGFEVAAGGSFDTLGWVLRC